MKLQGFQRKTKTNTNLSGKAIIRKDAYMKKEIHKINDGKMAEGVCGGIAKYFGIDVNIVDLADGGIHGSKNK